MGKIPEGLDKHPYVPKPHKWYWYGTQNHPLYIRMDQSPKRPQHCHHHSNGRPHIHNHKQVLINIPEILKRKKNTQRISSIINRTSLQYELPHISTPIHSINHIFHNSIATSIFTPRVIAIFVIHKAITCHMTKRDSPEKYEAPL